MTVDSLAVPPVCTVDDVASVLRYDGDTRERRRRVYDLVRAGQLAPIGGLAAGERLTSAMRFSGRSVVALVDGES